MVDLPEHFTRMIRGVYGDEGVAWLASLPELLASVAQRHELALGAPFDLSYNYVCAATRRDGTPIVLKFCPPNDEFYTETAALRHYDVRGCVELLAVDLDARAMIMERILPGQPLHDLVSTNDDAATHVVAEVMSNLWQPLPADHNFPTVAQWAEGLQRLRDANNGGTGPLPTHLVKRAEATYRELLASASPAVLLHGDLHHDNILSATRAPYLAIDPKGLAGEPAYEVGPFFYNPQPDIFHYPNLRQLFARRLAILVERLQIDRERLLACAFAHAVLSAAWSVEDQDDGWQETIRVAETLLQL
jgi:streptomycin 6-kinase